MHSAASGPFSLFTWKIWADEDSDQAGGLERKRNHLPTEKIPACIRTEAHVALDSLSSPQQRLLVREEMTYDNEHQSVVPLSRKLACRLLLRKAWENFSYFDRNSRKWLTVCIEMQWNCTASWRDPSVSEEDGYLYSNRCLSFGQNPQRLFLRQ